MRELEGRTVLITGAGRGIGRAEALYLADAGANVVVNDPGVATDGTGGDASVADAVVEEIRRRGGAAIADAGDVTRWTDVQTMIRRAIEAFGGLHAVVNNAAVEANAPLDHMSEADFDTVVAVKLKGAFVVTRCATEYWRDRTRSGNLEPRSVVNTVSGSGLVNPLPLQTNYAAANAGVAAMTTVHALELKRLGVRVNAVSPSMIRTRLTETVPGMDAPTDPAAPDPRDPVMIAPLVAHLASATCGFTGQVLSVRGTRIGVVHGWSTGTHIDTEAPSWDVADLARRLPELTIEDPFDHLAAALGGALGSADREHLESMINARLEA